MSSAAGIPNHITACFVFQRMVTKEAPIKERRRLGLCKAPYHIVLYNQLIRNIFLCALMFGSVSLDATVMVNQRRSATFGSVSRDAQAAVERDLDEDGDLDPRGRCPIAAAELKAAILYLGNP